MLNGIKQCLHELRATQHIIRPRTFISDFVFPGLITIRNLALELLRKELFAGLIDLMWVAVRRTWKIVHPMAETFVISDFVFCH